jgi:hypothetical protein
MNTAMPGAHVGGQRRGVGEQLDQVDLDVAGVGAAPGGRHVDAGRPAVAELGRGVVGPQRERLQHRQHLVDPLGIAVVRGQLADRHVQRGGDRRRSDCSGRASILPVPQSRRSRPTGAC